jgi:hypothetical protein
MTNREHPSTAAVGRRRGETLDDAIDRVAAALTNVPAAPDFSTRFRAGMCSRAPIRPAPLAMAAAALLVAAAVAVGVREPNRSEEPELRMGVAEPAADVAVARPQETPPASIERAAGQGRVHAVPPRRADVGRESAPPAIAALEPPESLGVEHLDLEPLAVLPVELVNLAVETLIVGDIDVARDPKE